jgi:integrase
MYADELQAFFAALDHEETPQLWSDFFKTTLLTGARSGNVKSMRWLDLELQRGLWRIGEAESKNKEPLLVILSPAVVEILQRRHKTNIASEYVFPSRSSTKHVTYPATAWKQICARANIRDLRVHDLRRTLGSWQAAAGTSLNIIGKSLGHRSLIATSVYARLNLDPVKASVNAANIAIMAAANGKPEQKALPAPQKE